MAGNKTTWITQFGSCVLISWVANVSVVVQEFDLKKGARTFAVKALDDIRIDEKNFF